MIAVFLYIKIWKMKNLWIILFSACVGALLNGMLTRSCQTEIPPQPQIIRDTTIVVQIDTQYFPEPVPYKVEVHDTVYLDKPYKGHVFTQQTKWFSDNSTYDMQVSGINVELDYIKTFPKTEVQYITTKETVYIQPQKWSLWANVEAGTIGGKPSIPLGAKLKYIKDQNSEYYLKGGTDLLNGGPYLMGGVDVKLF